MDKHLILPVRFQLQNQKVAAEQRAITWAVASCSCKLKACFRVKKEFGDPSSASFLCNS